MEQAIPQMPDRPAPVILLVEDNIDTQMIVTMQLRHYNWTVIPQPDGETALKWLQNQTPDLVILDLMLPGMDGLEVCRRIRERFSSSDLPILMLSALGSEAQDRVNGLDAGANDFMAKPYVLEELVARLRMLLDHKRQIATLSPYVTGELLRVSENSPELLSRRGIRQGVVLFADLRGFGRMAIQAPDRAIVAFDRFHEAMQSIINQHGGIVLNVAGNELMAAFNIPYDLPLASYLAVEAAMEIQRGFLQLQSEWKQSYLETGLGIGIHQGPVILGNVGGSELVRYTLIGDPVTVAQRFARTANDNTVCVSKEIFDEISFIPRKARITEEIFEESKQMMLVYHLNVIEKLPPGQLEEQLQQRHIDCQVLIAEDDPALRSVFVKVLEHAGFRVSAVTNGFEAAQHLQQNPPDVLLLDIGLPGRSGLEIIRQVRGQRQSKYINVIVITGDHLAAQSGEVEQADLVLIKPISTRDLANIVKRFIYG